MGMTQRKFVKQFPEYSTATYGTWRRQESAMGLDVLERILSKYPRLWYTVAIYLGINTEENLTGGMEPTVLKNGQSSERRAINEMAKAMEDLRSENNRLTKNNDKLTDIIASLLKPPGTNSTK